MSAQSHKNQNSFYIIINHETKQANLKRLHKRIRLIHTFPLSIETQTNKKDLFFSLYSGYHIFISLIFICINDVLFDLII